MRPTVAIVVLLLAASTLVAQVSTENRPSAAVSVRVVDAEGKAVPGIEIAGLWAAGGYRGEGDRKRMLPVGPTWKTGPEGTVEIEVPA